MFRGLDEMPSRRWVTVLALVAVATRLPVFLYAFFNGDEATYAALANAILDGHWLYAGAVDHKPPLIAVTYAAVLGVFGRYSLHAVHAASITAVALTGLLLARLAGRLGCTRPTSRLAGLLYVLSSAVGPGWDVLAANTELFMALPMTLGLLAITAASGANGRGTAGTADRPGLAFAGGALIAVAALYKYQAAAAAAPAMACLWLAGSWRIRLRGTVAMLAGLAVPVMALVGLYARAGHLGSLQFWAWTFPLRYAGALDRGSVALNGLMMTLAWGAPNLVLLVAAWQGRRSQPAILPGRARVVLFVWLAASVLGVAAGGRFFLHYYLQLLPPLSVLGAAGLRCLPDRAAWRRLAAAGVAVPLAGFWIASAADPFVRADVARDTAAYREIASLLRAHAAPGDTLFVWGNSSQLYVIARMPMGTRFPFCNYQSGKMWGTPADREGAIPSPRLAVQASWPMLLDDLQHRQPTWIVDAAEAGLDRWRGHEIARYPQLAAVISRDYEVMARPARASVYRRRAVPARGAGAAEGTRR